MNIVLIGSPASGKGTQAELLSQKFGLYHLSTGDVARRLIKTDKRLEKIYTSGQLIPEGEMTMHVINFISIEKPDLKDILFEGFPRFISQYEALSNFLKAKGDDIDIVLSLDVTQEEAVKRIASRRICNKCGENYNLFSKPPLKTGICDKCGGNLIQRSDDNEESVKVRFDFYRDNTKALIDYLDKNNKLTRVNGERSVEEIQNELIEIVEKLQKEQK